MLSSSKDSDGLSFGFHRDNRSGEKGSIKKTKWNNCVLKFLKNGFGFAGHQENATYGLRYKLTLQRSSDNHVLRYPAKADGAANIALAGRVRNNISWYAPHYTPNISQKNKVRAQCIKSWNRINRD